MNKFIIGTGYHERHSTDRYFAAAIWMRHLRRQLGADFHLAVITTGALFPAYGPKVQAVCGENLGHIGDLLNRDSQFENRNSPLCGWSATVLALCLIAYTCRRDLVYLEQDALAFGPWLEQAYSDMGDKKMIFGAKHESEPWMPCSQSLFIIRWHYLLTFVHWYIQMPDDIEMNPENKFVEIEKQSCQEFARLSFGVDRERPIPFDAPVFYAQRFTDEELDEARSRGLL